MTKTKILKFCICYKTCILKAPKYLVTGFCKVLYQIFIKVDFFLSVFIIQLLFSFHKIVLLVPNYHARSLARFFITRFRSSAKERMAFNSSLLKLKYVCCFLKIQNKSFSNLSTNISRAVWSLVGFHEDLISKHYTSLYCGVDSFRKWVHSWRLFREY